MPILSSSLGRQLDPVSTTSTQRALSAYAASLSGLSRGINEEPTSASGISLPFYCVCPEWFLINHPNNNVLGLSENEKLKNVHAFQQSRFYQRVEIDDRLITSGRVVALKQTSAGSLVTIECLTTLEHDTSLVARSLTGWMYRGLELDGYGGELIGGDHLDRQKQNRQCETKQTVIALDRWFPHRYTECSNIWNPIHTDELTAVKAGLPDIIVHGTALWALAGEEIIRNFCKGEPARLKGLNARFSSMVCAGTPITVKYSDSPLEDGSVFFQLINSNGNNVIMEGTALVV